MFFIKTIEQIIITNIDFIVNKRISTKNYVCENSAILYIYFVVKLTYQLYGNFNFYNTIYFVLCVIGCLSNCAGCCSYKKLEGGEDNMGNQKGKHYYAK